MSKKPDTRIIKSRGIEHKPMDELYVEDRRPIDMCEGHEEELNGIMRSLYLDEEPAPSAQQRAKLEDRADLLNRKLDERNRRLDQPHGPIWRGM